MTWLEVIIEALKALGGYAHRSDIFLVIEDQGKKNLTEFWKKSVQSVIQTHSTDSDAYDRSNPDIFYTYQKGSGCWGLRDFIPTDKEIDFTEDDLSFPEGKISLKKHVCRERNYKLVFLAKKSFKDKNNGELFCEICKFNFFDIYGEEFIEAHHIKPVCELKDNEITKIEDLVMVCSNCHRMLHRQKPWLKKDEFNKIFKTLE